MVKKKWMGMQLALCMVVCIIAGMIPTASFAQENAADNWDGTADTSWYEETKAEFEISTAEQLAGLAVLVNGTEAGEYNDYKTFEGKTVYLTTDIDLSGYEWVSIGSGANMKAKAFCGIFDGQNHTITGLYSHEDYVSEDSYKTEHNTIRTGLFGAVYNGTIKNIGVIDADILISEKDTSTYGMGIIADWFTGSSMYNCYSTGSITGGSYVEKYIGGLIGYGNGNNTIQKCYSQASITGNYSNSGDYYSDGMKYWDSLGGIIGASYTGTTTINDCWFDGKIIVNSIQAPVGGIIGYSERAKINNCMVATVDIGDDGNENTFWIAYEVRNVVNNCIYPKDEKYGTSPANYPEEGEIAAGIATDTFNDVEILSKLNENAAEGIVWVEGIKHPTFAGDVKNIAADYSKVDEAIAKANALNKTEYKDFSGVEAAIAAVVRDKNITEQSVVDRYAAAIENAINALERKSTDYNPAPPAYNISDTTGGSVTVDKPNAKPGDKVTIIPRPEDGMRPEYVEITDKDGNRIGFTDNGDGTYTFVQPERTVNIKVTFTYVEEQSTPVTQDSLAKSPQTGDSSNMFWLCAMLAVGLDLAVMVYAKKENLVK